MTSDGIRGELVNLVERAMPDDWSVAHLQLIVVGKLSETTARVLLEDGFPLKIWRSDWAVETTSAYPIVVTSWSLKLP